MKKIKKLKYIIFALIVVFSFSNNIKAGSGYSMEGGSGTGGGDTSNPGGYKRTLGTLGYRVSLVYYKPGDTTSLKILGHQNFIAKNFSSKYKNGVTGLKISYSGTKLNFLKPTYSPSFYKSRVTFGEDPAIPDFSIGISPNGCTEGCDYAYDFNTVTGYYSAKASQGEAVLKQEISKMFGMSIETIASNNNIPCEGIKYMYILLEPMQVWGKPGEYYYGTVSELQYIASSKTPGITLNNQMASYITTPSTVFTDSDGTNATLNELVGVGSKASPGVNNNLTTKNKAWGVGIIWVGQVIKGCEECYVDSADVTKGELSCKNTDKNNEVTISEKWSKVACNTLTEADKKVAKVNTQFGKFVKKEGDCNVYCTTSAKLSLPGNISNGKYAGDFFQWPTIGGTYPLTMAETKTCVLVSTTGSYNNCNFDYKTVFDDNGSSTGGKETFSINFTGGTNKKINSEKLSWTKDAAYVSKTTASGQVFSITRKVEFKLPNNKNRYFNRITNEVSDIGVESSNVVDRSNGLETGFVSTSINDKTNVTYSLMLDNIKAGTSAKINDLLKNKTYTCTYNLSNLTLNYCPEGTARAGQPLYLNGRTYEQAVEEDCKVTVCPTSTPHSGKVINLNGRTFNQAVQQDCTCDVEESKDSDWDNLTITEKCNNDATCINKCSGIVLFCPKESTYPGKKVELNGRTYSEAVQQDCYDNDCKENCVTTTLPSAANEIKVKKTECNGKLCGINYYCPQEDSTMDPTNCITQQLKIRGFSTGLEGYSQANAAGVLSNIFTSCKMTVCESGKRIIYRVIDLDNPFPGKYNRSYVSGFSNTNTNGRYPGANWNEIVLVKNKILNARGVKGYNLYNKTPLYTIKLTPDDIQNIREYNKNHEYSDFNLKCKTSGSTTKCISTFLHEKFSKILTSGTCKHLSEGSSVDDFNKCYNEG